MPCTVQSVSLLLACEDMDTRVVPEEQGGASLTSASPGLRPKLALLTTRLKSSSLANSAALTPP